MLNKEFCPLNPLLLHLAITLMPLLPGFGKGTAKSAYVSTSSLVVSYTSKDKPFCVSVPS